MEHEYWVYINNRNREKLFTDKGILILTKNYNDILECSNSDCFILTKENINKIFYLTKTDFKNITFDLVNKLIENNSLNIKEFKYESIKEAFNDIFNIGNYCNSTKNYLSLYKELIGYDDFCIMDNNGYFFSNDYGDSCNFGKTGNTVKDSTDKNNINFDVIDTIYNSHNGFTISHYYGE